MKNFKTGVVVTLLMACAFYAGLQAEDIQRLYRGTLKAEKNVYDGDTLTDAMVRVAGFNDRGEVWPGIFITDTGVVIQTDLRLAGIDTPERRPRKTWPDGTARSEASRDREKELARQAQVFLSHLIFEVADNDFIVKNPVLGKYAGRVICEVWVPNPRVPGKLLNVSQILLDADIAKPYDGKGPRPLWD